MRRGPARTLRIALASLAALWTLALAAPVALADGMQACSDAYTQAQVSRKDRKLLDARAQLQTCAQLSCPAFIHKDCAQWLDEVQAAVPSVVAVAQDDAGTNLVEVALSLDGKPLAPTLDGRAIELDPGPHTFTFVTSDGDKQQAQVLVAEGERDKRVTVTFHRPGATPPPGPATPAPPTGMSTLQTTGLAVAGLGVVALGIGGAFGLVAIQKQSAADCPNNVCGPSGNPSTLRSAVSAANVSTWLFVGGGVLAAGGVALWLLAPPASPGSATGSEHTAWLGATPVATPGGGGLVLTGGW